MRRNGQNSTSGQICNPKSEMPMGCFLFEYEIWWASAKIYTCFERKTASVMQNFQNLGAGGGWGNHFLTKPPKGTSLPDFTHFEPLCVRIRSRVFPPGVTTKKKGHYKKSQRGYISPICGEFSTQPNLTKIGLWLGVADIINHTKFGKDRSREYKVTEGRILACLSPITL